jgi:NAD(P)H-dependent flavin oxidoreductase YrpB (nitropropane dioxygenase family)
VIAHFASGEGIVRYEPAPPMVGTTGDIEATSMWAGQSVALAKKSQPAAEIVAELISRLLAGQPARRGGRRLFSENSRRPVVQ